MQRNGSLSRGLAARGESRTEPFGADSARMQGRAKRRILGVFKRARTQQTGQNLPERRRGDFRHGLLGPHARQGTPSLTQRPSHDLFQSATAPSQGGAPA